MNLLDDRPFRVVTPDGKITMSLPALLAALGRDKVESLPGLKRHQEDAFLVFLSQLGAGILARTDESSPVQDEKFWREAIRKVTGMENDLAWTLIVEDFTKPAFMQPPLPYTEKMLKYLNSEKEAFLTPDELDILITSKNHDIKMTRGDRSLPDDWIYSLITKQTMSGYIGQRYGIARMNSGSGNRPFVEFRFSDRFGNIWLRNVGVLLKIRKRLLQATWKYKDKGLLFVWTQEWHWPSSISLNELDPFFIEISRAIRLKNSSSGIHAFDVPPKPICARINSKASKGDIGDPWIPIVADKDGLKALTVSEDNGFTPKRVCDIFFENGIQRPAMMSYDCAPDGPAWFYASALIRGDGKTFGLDTVKIPIPPKARKTVFGANPERNKLGDISQSGLHNAEAMWGKVLRPALLTFLKGGPTPKENANKKGVQKKAGGKTKDMLSDWLKEAEQRFRLEWESQFYDWLWNSVGEEKDAAIKRWAETLKEIAVNIFEDSIKRLPSRTGRQMRSVVRAESVFNGSMHNNFPMLRKETTDAENP